MIHIAVDASSLNNPVGAIVPIGLYIEYWVIAINKAGEGLPSNSVAVVL